MVRLQTLPEPWSTGVPAQLMADTTLGLWVKRRPWSA